MKTLSRSDPQENKMDPGPNLKENRIQPTKKHGIRQKKIFFLFTLVNRKGKMLINRYIYFLVNTVHCTNLSKLYYYFYMFLELQQPKPETKRYDI